MAAENSSGSQEKGTLPKFDESHSDLNLKIYATINKFCFILDAKGINRTSLGLLPSEHDYSSLSDAERKRTHALIHKNLRKIFSRRRSFINRTTTKRLKDLNWRYQRSVKKPYPPLDLKSITSQHRELYDVIAQCSAFEFDITDEVGWKQYHDLYEKAFLLDDEFQRASWLEIEKHDKYHFDAWRYTYARIGFWIAIIVFFLVNIKPAFNTVKDVIVFIANTSKAIF